MNSDVKKTRRVVVLADDAAPPSDAAGATTVVVLPSARMDAAGVLALVAARRDLTVLAPAVWFPVLTIHGGVRANRFHCGLTTALDGEQMIAFPAASPGGGNWCEHLLAALLLLLSSPLLLLAAILVRLGDGGPAFFVQERFGRAGRPFRLVKLRTMHPEAETQRHALASSSPAGRPFKVDDDPRATMFGRWLRRHGLDELPQLLNIVRGEMRLVGSRPLPDYEDRHYTQSWHRARLDGLPGLTGLWQVSGRNERTFDEMCQLDIWYLRNRGVWLDLRILLRTWRVIWRGE
jgi:lipopolysaccharide/colanic/teichoic acid biosynthesis glycosyltransferase